MKLQFHEEHQVKKAYREAQRFEELELQFEELRRLEVIKAVEEAGWVGLKVDPPKGSYGYLRAFKGKHGPCRDGEQLASYEGSFLGVWDDDHHLILNGSPLPVCIKTAGVYRQNQYGSFLKVDPPEAKGDMGSFDCDDLQKNLDRLEVLLPKKKDDNEDLVSVYYGGPFSKAVTSEGHLLFRGKCSLVSRETVSRLKGEGVVLFEDSEAELLTLDHQPTQRPPSSKDIVPDWSALKRVSSGLKEKLLRALERNRDVMILTGSDPQEESGCCPSEDVGSANDLVRSGILDLAEKNEDGEGCSITFYGIPRERLGFSGETAFRDHLLNHLQPQWERPLRVLLLTCVALAIVSGFYRLSQQRSQAPVALESLLTEGQSVHLVLFQELPRCPPCLEMEALVKEFSSQQKIPFTILELNDGRYLSAVERYGLFSATVFVLKKNGEKKEALLHLPAAELWRQPEAFHASLRQALNLD